MIEKLENISKDWKKPWFTEGSLQWPRNLSGRCLLYTSEKLSADRMEKSVPLNPSVRRERLGTR